MLQRTISHLSPPDYEYTHTSYCSQWTRKVDQPNLRSSDLSTKYFTKNVLPLLSKLGFMHESQGLVAFGQGPFMERAEVYLIPETTKKALRVGRYVGYEYKENHIKFQDHSVGIEGGQISFGRRLEKKAVADGEGFNGCSYRFKCSDMNGVLYAHTGQKGVRV